MENRYQIIFHNASLGGNHHHLDSIRVLLTISTSKHGGHLLPYAKRTSMQKWHTLRLKHKNPYISQRIFFATIENWCKKKTRWGTACTRTPLLIFSVRYYGIFPCPHIHVVIWLSLSDYIKQSIHHLSTYQTNYVRVVR